MKAFSLLIYQAIVLLEDCNGLIAVEFKGSCLKQGTATLTYRNVVNLFIASNLDAWSRDLTTKFTLGDFLFGAVKLTENGDPEKHWFVGCDTGFGRSSDFPINGERGWNIIIFGFDKSLSVHSDNRKKKDMLVVDELPTDGLDD